MKNDDDFSPWPQRERPDPAPAPVSEPLPEPPMPPWGYYYLGAWIVGLLTFAGTWVWAISKYGFLIGVGLAWFPSLIVGVIAGAAWPLVLFAAYLLATWLYHTGAL